MIGQAGVGKSTIGILLDEAGIDVVDLDKHISDIEGARPEEIIIKRGLSYFREAEYQALLSIVDKSSGEESRISKSGDQRVTLVILGAGFVESEKSVELLQGANVILIKRSLLKVLFSIKGRFRGYSFLQFIINWVKRMPKYQRVLKKASSNSITLRCKNVENSLKNIHHEVLSWTEKLP